MVIENFGVDVSDVRAHARAIKEADLDNLPAVRSQALSVQDVTDGCGCLTP